MPQLNWKEIFAEADAAGFEDFLPTVTADRLRTGLSFSRMKLHVAAMELVQGYVDGQIKHREFLGKL